MLTYAIRYIVALLILGAGDAAWLGYFGRTVFRPTLGPILCDPPKWSAAILFYLLYPLGILFFGVAPALQLHSINVAVLYGALFGFMAYMTYDLTNLATIRAWTIRLAALDIVWGTFISALCCLGCYLVSRVTP